MTDGYFCHDLQKPNDRNVTFSDWYPVTTPSTKDGTIFMHKFAMPTLSVHCEPLGDN